MRIFFFLVCLSFTGVANSTGNDTAVVVQLAYSNNLNITAQLKYYNCGYKNTDSALAYMYYTANKFLPAEKTNNEFINYGYINSEKWFAVPVENNADIDVNAVLEFISSGLNKINCYEVNEVQHITTSSSSVKDAVNNSALSKLVIFNIFLSAGEKSCCFFIPLIMGTCYTFRHIFIR